MAIPLATTTVTVTRPTIGEPDEPPTGDTTLATGVRAHLSSPSGFEQLVGGTQGRIDKTLGCDPFTPSDGGAFDRTCIVVDDTTGTAYSVAWVDHRIGLGLDHYVGGLNITAGRA